VAVKVRLIPVLLLQNGLLVRSEQFRIHQIIGNPINEVKRYNEWNVDELVYLDITREGHYDMRRDDHRHKGMTGPMEILEQVSRTCFVPLTWGGRLRTVEQMRECFRRGADKIVLNSAAWSSPDVVTEAAKRFGNQAVVVSMDVRKHPDGRYEVFVEGGRTSTGVGPVEWARRAAGLGAGELLLQSIDRDGTAEGYDTGYIDAVAAAVSIPVIACSGVGLFEHYVDGVHAGASAVAAANIWHFKELADRQGKRALAQAGVNVRFKFKKRK